MSDLIPWTDDLLVNVEAIDNDHKKLIDLMNAYFQSMDHGETAISSAIGALSSYTKHHFTTEQASMERAGYPKLREHIDQHDYLIFELERMMYRLMDVGKGVDNDLVAMLRGWLCDHIMVHDTQYAAFLRESGKTG